MSTQAYEQEISRISPPDGPTFRPARRVQESLLAGTEKRLLVWLARRTPSWIHSDHLTLLGFGAQLLAGLSYAASAFTPVGLVAATAFLGLNWLGDSLDGTLARVRNRQRPRYGFYVDHIVDTFGAFFLLGGLACSGYMSELMALGVLIAFLMLTAEIYLAAYTVHEFRLSHWIFGPTEIRVILAIGNTALLWRPTVHLLGRELALFDVGAAVAITGMVLMLVVSSIRHTWELYRAEPLP